ncbi:glycine betaine ABC transporter substrate-binding protein [Methanoculleus frigidifontis]|nr:glycine betaine ABC transporter substrate-binding protein [Methanoculleus sp. FWC-SCC1]
MVYTPWGTAISSANVMKQVLEEAGYDVELKQVDVGLAFQAVAGGNVDCFIDAWVPSCHGSYMNEYEGQMDFVRYNMEGTRCGLVVPSYVTIDSIDELNSVKDKFDGQIIGIEPGAGIMGQSEDAIEEYGLDYTVIAGSEVGMLTTLSSAIDKEEWVVVTGWTPHWKFARWDLKYLDDPKGVYGGEEYIATLARLGLQEDKPEAYAILERFHWTADDMCEVMYAIEQGIPEDEAAAAWIAGNHDQVDAWLGKA